MEYNMNSGITYCFCKNDIAGIKLDESAINMPITFNNKCLGVIVGVDENIITFLLWNKDWSINYNEEGKFSSLELNDLDEGKEHNYF